MLAAILLIAFMGQSFNQGWYYIGYLIQKKEYVKRCANKARPMMHCNGKCQLMKKIQAQEKKEQGQPPEMKFASRVEVLSSRSSFLLQLNIPVISTPSHFILFTTGIPVDQSSAIFHPPPASC
ncbi:MAG: hypothetical protein QM781_11305 [Chitinophagaceae bacterium]